MDCIFCKIINKEIPSEIIYEDEKVIAILDAFPQSDGHTLIIPKSHAENIMEINSDFELTKYIQIVAKKLQAKYDFSDFKVITNKGKKAGQEVFHLHIHIVPFY